MNKRWKQAVMFAVLTAFLTDRAQQGRAVEDVEPATQVSIENFTFRPAMLTVTPGTKVTWTNRDDVPHTVVESEKSFRSPTLDTDDRYSHVFATPGKYTYYCGVHPHMTGAIYVK